MKDIAHSPTVLKIYFYFRTFLSLVLLTSFLISQKQIFLGIFEPSLYFWAALFYAALTLITLILIRPHQLVRSFNRVVGLLITDVVILLILMHTSGGIESGLGYLLLVFVAIAATLIPGQLGIAFAAMTTLLVIAETVYLYQIKQVDSRILLSAGLLGALLFTTAFSFQFLNEKIRQSLKEAADQAAFAAHLQKLAQAIVARMRTGILVVDDELNIELMNDSAKKLLLMDDTINNLVIDKCPDVLKNIIIQWQQQPDNKPPKLVEAVPGHPLRISLSKMDFNAQARTVVYVEDHRLMAQQAQQLKLASLGRLTASIAHEIRNPLGAISHAAQLLAESPYLKGADKRLTEIIHQHSHRVNQIVENTLALSRRKESSAETFDLIEWLPKFIEQFKSGQNVVIDTEVEPSDHKIKFDKTQLSQVLTNLLDNGLRYSRAATGQAKMLLRVKKVPSDDLSYLELIDFGPGIPDEQVNQVFDPFYTTEERGSGLGLYICKELCEIHQANLSYQRTAEHLSCFVISFSHHQRWF